MIGNGICWISHLQFANDTVIFCEVDITQLGFLRCILCCFELVSGLKIHLAKSELFQIGDVPNIESLASILGCKIGSLAASYLGMSLGSNFKS